MPDLASMGCALNGTSESEVRYLYVGRFDGRAFRVMESSESIEAA